LSSPDSPWKRRPMKSSFINSFGFSVAGSAESCLEDRASRSGTSPASPCRIRRKLGVNPRVAAIRDASGRDRSTAPPSDRRWAWSESAIQAAESLSRAGKIESRMISGRSSETTYELNRNLKREKLFRAVAVRDELAASKHQNLLPRFRQRKRARSASLRLPTQRVTSYFLPARHSQSSPINLIPPRMKFKPGVDRTPRESDRLSIENSPFSLPQP